MFASRHTTTFLSSFPTLTHASDYIYSTTTSHRTHAGKFFSLSLSLLFRRGALIYLSALLSTLQICKRAARAMQISCSRERGLAVLTHSLYAALSRASSGDREHVFYCREWSLARGARVYTSAQCSFRAA